MGAQVCISAKLSPKTRLDISILVHFPPGALLSRCPFELMEFGDGLRPTRGEGLQDGGSLLRRGPQGVANDAAVSKVARTQAHAGRPSGDRILEGNSGG